MGAAPHRTMTRYLGILVCFALAQVLQSPISGPLALSETPSTSRAIVGPAKLLQGKITGRDRLLQETGKARPSALVLSAITVTGAVTPYLTELGPVSSSIPAPIRPAVIEFTAGRGPPRA